MDHSDEDKHDTQIARILLQSVLHLNPIHESQTILKKLSFYVDHPQVLPAEIVDQGHDELTLAQIKLNQLRGRIWDLHFDQNELLAGLEQLQQSGFAGISTTARKLQQVAQVRQEVVNLRHKQISPLFFQAFCSVLIADGATANRIREAQQRHMRPERNEHYLSACNAIQSSVSMIRHSAPYAYRIEESWLNEILQYNPVEEQDSESQNQSFGCLFMITIFVFFLRKLLGDRQDFWMVITGA